jgi:hypothetical protein
MTSPSLLPSNFREVARIMDRQPRDFREVALIKGVAG